MALLAEPKRKAKFGLDPRNTNWSNDDNKIGQRLMEKMGWEKGKGLGANEDGMKEHIKASYKSDSRGLGFTAKDADAWIAHQDDFNELLKTLNSQSDPEQPKEKIKDDQRPPDGHKRYRGRFARGSMPTLRSVEDLDCIFGNRKSKSNNDSDAEAEEHKHGLTSVTSSTSVQEYFAKKMAEMKARKEGSTKEDDGEVNASQQSTSGKESSEKRVPPVYGNVMFNYEENEPDTKESNNTEKDLDTKLDRGWYQEWPGENVPESKTQKKKKNRKDKNPLKDSNVIDTVVPNKAVEPEDTTKKIKKLKKHKKEKIYEENLEGVQGNKNGSSSCVDKCNGNDLEDELTETGESSGSTKKSKKNRLKSMEKGDENQAVLVTRQEGKDNKDVNGLEVTDCVEGSGNCDMEQVDIKKSKKKKSKKVVYHGVQDSESTETILKSKRKREKSNTASDVTVVNMDGDSLTVDLDEDEVPKKKKKKKDNQDQSCTDEKTIDGLIAESEVETKKSKKRKREDSEFSDGKGKNIVSAENQKNKTSHRIDKKKKKLNRKKEKSEIKKQKAAENSIFPGSNISDINGYAMSGKAIPSQEQIVNKINRKKKSKKRGSL